MGFVLLTHDHSAAAGALARVVSASQVIRPGEVIVSIEGSSAPDFSSFAEAHPFRIVVDWAHSAVDPHLREQTFARGLVRRISFEEIESETTKMSRVSVELRAKTDYAFSTSGSKILLRLVPPAEPIKDDEETTQPVLPVRRQAHAVIATPAPQRFEPLAESNENPSPTPKITYATFANTKPSVVREASASPSPTKPLDTHAPQVDEVEPKSVHVDPSEAQALLDASANTPANTDAIESDEARRARLWKDLKSGPIQVVAHPASNEPLIESERINPTPPRIARRETAKIEQPSRPADASPTVAMQNAEERKSIARNDAYTSEKTEEHSWNAHATDTRKPHAPEPISTKQAQAPPPTPVALQVPAIPKRLVAQKPSEQPAPNQALAEVESVATIAPSIAAKAPRHEAPIPAPRPLAPEPKRLPSPIATEKSASQLAPTRLAEFRPVLPAVTMPARMQTRLAKEEGSTSSDAFDPGPRVLTYVGFRRAGQGAEVFVRTDGRPKYRIEKTDSHHLVVHLENTRVNVKNNERPLDTSFFNVAVTKVQAVTMGSTTQVMIELRDAVPFEIKRVGNTLSVEFKPSTSR